MHAAIVTGVSRGLGEALAAAMLARGFTVLGVGRTASPRLTGKRFHLAACDLSQPALLAAAVTPPLRLIAADKPTTVTLVNNAAVATPTGLVGKLDAGEVASAFSDQCGGAGRHGGSLLPELPRRFGRAADHQHLLGRGADGDRRHPVYGMSKAALEMLTRAIVAECSAPRFRCISLRPGIFETGMQAYMRTRDPAEFPSAALFRGFKENGLLKDPADVAARIVDKLVLAPVEHGRTYSHTDF